MERNVPKLRFKGFNDEWKECKLSDICTVITKGTTPKKFNSTGIKYIKIESLYNGKINRDKCLYVAKETHEGELKRSILEEGDILFAIAGSLGKCAIVTKQDLPANTNQALSILRLKENINNKMIINILKSTVMDKYIKVNLSVGAQPNLNLEQINNFKFKLPSVTEQERIANFLTKVDKIIEKQDEKVKNLEKYKKGMMQKIFSQEIRFKDENGKEYPEWKEKRLGDFIIEYAEKTIENNQYEPLTSSRKGLFLQSEYFNKQIASEDNTGYNIVPKGYFTYRHMSDDSIFYFNINNIIDFGIVSTLYPVFTVNEGMNSKFLRYYLNEGYDFKKYCLLQKQGGSRTYMYLNKLKEFRGKFPVIMEQNKIANFLTDIDTLVNKEKEKLEELKQLKKGLLQQMFI